MKARVTWLAGLLACMMLPAAAAEITITKVSYDPTRKLHPEFGAAFAAEWAAKTGQQVKVVDAPQAESSQTQSVIEGVQADVVSLALTSDVDLIAASGKIPADWQGRLPNGSTPYFSTVAFLVHKGNPKGIKDWDDLIRPDVAVATPDPRRSGGARWNYLAAFAYGLSKNNRDFEAAKAFVAAVYRNVPELLRGTTATANLFFESKVADVLLAWEANAFLALEKYAAGDYEIVVPSISILAEPKVSLIDDVVDARGTRAVAQAYIDFLYSPAGQEIAAKNYYRPQLPEVAAKYADRFPKVTMVSVADAFGGWTNAQKTHFEDGGVFDQIYKPAK